jgi:hypothetical protein
VKDFDDPDRYYLPTSQRHLVWQNEIARFIVVGLPLVVAAFWYGSTIQTVDFSGHVLSPGLVSRGIGLALVTAFLVTAGGAVSRFVQPAIERVRGAQPIRGRRRLAFAGFDGLLIGIVTSQSLPDFHVNGDVVIGAISIAIGVAAALIAYVSMVSMVEIPYHSSTRAGVRPGRA